MRGRTVKVLDRFEQGVERLFEGSIGRVFRSPVQPAEIGRKLERAMVDGKVVSVDRPLAPNDFRVAMHPADTVLFADYVGALCRQMEQWLAEVARTRGFALVDRVRVAIDADPTVPRRAIRVTAVILDRSAAGPDAGDEIQRTEVYRPIRTGGGVPPLRLRLVDGPRRDQEVLIRKPVTTVGRALDNDLVLEAGDVSRHHARLEYAATTGEVRLVDLGSTNGTRVNGRRVDGERVRPGDEVAFGTVRARLLPFEEGR
jgi:hypothetical protein